MEPECAVAYREGGDNSFPHSGSQNVYDDRREVSRMLGISLRESVKVHEVCL